MNEIKVITELCAEDRARVDKLTEALLKNVHNCEGCVQATIRMAQDQHAADKPTDVPKNASQEPAEQEAPATTPKEEEKPTEAKEAPTEEPKPTVTLAQIQQKVVQLCAGFDGKKKPAVREIISAYGAKVSDLKDQPEKWDEVWDKLIKLEEQ